MIISWLLFIKLSYTINIDEKLKREGVLPRSSSVKSVSRNESLREDQDDELFFSEEEK